MKRLMGMIAVVCVASIATADIYQWAWEGGLATDKDGTALVAGELTAQTFTTDLSGFVVGGQININDLMAAYDIAGVGVAPNIPTVPTLNGQYTSANTPAFTDVSLEDSFVYLVIKDGLGEIAVGDFIGFGLSGEVLDRKPTDDPQAPGQLFAGGDVQTNVQVVIPEPATFGLMGIAGLGLFLARKKVRS